MPHDDVTSILCDGSSGSRSRRKSSAGYVLSRQYESVAADDSDGRDRQTTDDDLMVTMDTTDAEDDKSPNHSGSDEDDSLLVAYDSNSVGSV